MHRLEVRSIAAEVEMASFPPGYDRHSRKSEIIDDQVSRPGDQLMAYQLREHANWDIFHEMYDLRNEFRARVPFGHPVFFNIWNKRDVFLDIVGDFVVEGVSDFPRVKWNEQEGMNYQTQNIVDPFFFTQSSMSAFVSQLPQAGEEETLGEGIRYPSQIARSRARKVWNCHPSKYSQDSNKKEIPTT